MRAKCDLLPLPLPRCYQLLRGPANAGSSPRQRTAMKEIVLATPEHIKKSPGD
jgi:hypothetical protein